MIYKGIIVRCSQYKDYDAMINLLTKDGLISFKGRSVYKYDNKNSILSTPLLYGDFIFSDNNDKFLLFKEVNPIFDSRKYLNDIKILSVINFINEILIKLINEEDLLRIYDDLIYILLNINELDLSFALTFILAKSLIISGYGLDTSGYNLEKNISYDYINSKFIDFSLFDGAKNRRFTKKEKELLFEVFNLDIKSIKNNQYKNEEIKRVLFDLINYTNSCFGITLKSTKIIEKVL